MSDAQAQPAGKPMGRIDKRPGDARPYTIDCSLVLRPHELITAVADAPVGNGVLIAACRPRKGFMVELQLAGGEVPDERPYIDTPLRLTLSTTQGRIEILVAVRIHAL